MLSHLEKTLWPSPNAVPDERTLLAGLMQDHELMGLLGLQVPWDSDMKRVDPDRDFKGFDPGDLS